MKKKITYIPTLQEYMRKRKKQRIESLELENCKDCDYYREDSNVCLWEDGLRKLMDLKVCPITNRDLKN